MTTKVSHRLTLTDRLSRLTFYRACQLLGPHGRELIQQGAAYDTIDLERDVYLRGDLFRLRLSAAGGAIVTITAKTSARDRLHFNCTTCETVCEHIGAAFSLILEEKMALGLSAPPPERVPAESLGEEALVERALDDRAERARTERFRLRSENPKKPWVDYTIISAVSGKAYRLALRGEARGESYCSCPDFRTNTLGTCKHILYALERVRRLFSATARRKPPRHGETFVHVLYGKTLTLHFN